MFGDFEIRLSPTGNWQLKFINIYNEITISDDENEYKKRNYMTISKENNEYSILQIDESKFQGTAQGTAQKEVKHNYTFFILNIVTETKQLIQIRSGNRISLEYLVYHVHLLFYLNI